MKMRFFEDRLRQSPLLLIQNSPPRSIFDREDSPFIDHSPHERDAIKLPSVNNGALQTNRNCPNEWVLNKQKNKNRSSKFYDADRTFNILPGFHSGVVCAFPLLVDKRFLPQDECKDIPRLSKDSKVFASDKSPVPLGNEVEADRRKDLVLGIVRANEIGDFFEFVSNSEYHGENTSQPEMLSNAKRIDNSLIYFDRKYWNYYNAYDLLLHRQDCDARYHHNHKNKIDVSIVRIPDLSVIDETNFDTSVKNEVIESTIYSNDNDLDNPISFDNTFDLVTPDMSAVLTQYLTIEKLFQWKFLKDAKAKGEISLTNIWQILRKVKDIIPSLGHDGIVSHNPYSISFNQFIAFAQTVKQQINAHRTAPPDLNLRLLKVGDSWAKINIETDRACRLKVVAVLETERPPPLEKMTELSFKSDVPYEEKIIESGEIKEFNLTSLKCGSQYGVHIYWERLVEGKNDSLIKSSFDDTQKSRLKFETKKEINSYSFLPNWDELDRTDQVTEFFAAVRDYRVLAECSKNNLNIPSIPDQKDYLEDFDYGLWEDAIKWWGENKRLREDFCFREVKFAARDEQTRKLAAKENIRIAPGDWNSCDVKKLDMWQKFCCWYYGIGCTKSKTISSFPNESLGAESNPPKTSNVTKGNFVHEVGESIHLLPKMYTFEKSSSPNEKIGIVELHSNKFLSTLPKKSNTVNDCDIFKEKQLIDIQRFTVSPVINGRVVSWGQNLDNHYCHGEDNINESRDRFPIEVDKSPTKGTKSMGNIIFFASAFVKSIFNGYSKDKIPNGNMVINPRDSLTSLQLEESLNFGKTEHQTGAKSLKISRIGPDACFNLDTKENEIKKNDNVRCNNQIERCISTFENSKENPHSSSSIEKTIKSLSQEMKFERNISIQQKSDTFQKKEAPTEKLMSTFKGVRRARNLFLNSRMAKVDEASKTVRNLVELTSNTKKLRGLQLLRAKAKLVIISKKLGKIGFKDKKVPLESEGNYNLDLFEDLDDSHLDLIKKDKYPIYTELNKSKNGKRVSKKEQKPIDIVDIDDKNEIMVMLDHAIQFHNRRNLKKCFKAMVLSVEMKRRETIDKSNTLSDNPPVKDNNPLEHISDNDVGGKDEKDLISKECKQAICKKVSSNKLGKSLKVANERRAWERRMFSWEDYRSRAIQIDTKNKKRLAEKNAVLAVDVAKGSSNPLKSKDIFRRLDLQKYVEGTQDYFGDTSMYICDNMILSTEYSTLNSEKDHHPQGSSQQKMNCLSPINSLYQQDYNFFPNSVWYKQRQINETNDKQSLHSIEMRKVAVIECKCMEKADLNSSLYLCYESKNSSKENNQMSREERFARDEKNQFRESKLCQAMNLCYNKRKIDRYVPKKVYFCKRKSRRWKYYPLAFSNHHTASNNSWNNSKPIQRHIFPINKKIRLDHMNTEKSAIIRKEDSKLETKPFSQSGKRGNNPLEIAYTIGSRKNVIKCPLDFSLFEESKTFYVNYIDIASCVQKHFWNNEGVVETINQSKKDPLFPPITPQNGKINIQLKDQWKNNIPFFSKQMEGSFLRGLKC